MVNARGEFYSILVFLFFLLLHHPRPSAKRLCFLNHDNIGYNTKFA